MIAGGPDGVLEDMPGVLEVTTDVLEVMSI